ncbi:hypothetical protein D3C84_945500 [compost metagenome]
MGIDPLHKARGACLNHSDITFVERQDTGYFEAGLKDATSDSRKTQTKILGQARIDTDGRTIPDAAGVLGDQLHVHKGGLTRVIELLLRVHGVIPVQSLAFIQ